MPIQVGKQAPDIKTPEFSLSAFQGQRLVVFFFPKADTPGCTTEACEFRDARNTLAAKNAVVVGISPDKKSSQQKFAAKYSLPFILVADPDHAIAEAYGVWKEKSMYGRKYMGIERTTFLIDEQGNIARIFAKVKPSGHAAQVLEALAN
jgi:peroxiredoxin Q/BCP